MDFLIDSLLFISVLYISAVVSIESPGTNLSVILSTTQGLNSTEVPAALLPKTVHPTRKTDQITTSTESKERHIGTTVPLTPPVRATDSGKSSSLSSSFSCNNLWDMADHFPGKPSVTSVSSSTESLVHQQTGLTGILMSIHSTASSTSTGSPGSEKENPLTFAPYQSTPSSSLQLSRATTPTLFLGNSPKNSLLSPTPSPSAQPPSSLTMLAFGVMTFILILIIVMVILVTTVNMRGRCKNNEEKGKKSWDSVTESNVTTNGEKESITLISVRTINTETDTDSPHLSSVHSTILDNEELDVCKD